ncbi:MAG: C-GCAxxG-C-C family (seleno)protein [Atribacterota bacterium]|nr:C-GCAxxG-C-C family (seleno)protein [Atribacterota bacterium]MDD4895621.1 C-GCAxxG-C-C family (seleno)protein [Atribacterota bacterium]MDD5636712.1 C-GCAxxG-C-C family (seleno)protein [Atribacterota bacterium]
MTLKELIEQGFYPKNDLNCAETILYGANQVYNLGLSRDCLRLSAAFGGGMGTENVCGVVTASVMVLGYLFVKDHAHQNPEIKDICKELFELYTKKLGDFDCKPLKDKYRTEEKKCFDVILKGAEILDYIISKEKRKRERQ